MILLQPRNVGKTVSLDEQFRLNPELKDAFEAEIKKIITDRKPIKPKASGLILKLLQTL